MTSQDLTDLARKNLKEFNRQECITSQWPDYGTTDMIAFHKQGIKEGIKLLSGTINRGEDPMVLVLNLLDSLD